MSDTSMSDQDDQLSLWIRDFRQAAILRFNGEALGLDQVRDAGMNRYTELVHGRDAAVGPGARDVLIPLLNDPDDSVRVIAAAYLLTGRPDIALPVLKDLEENCMTDAHTIAYLVILMYEAGTFKI